VSEREQILHNWYEASCRIVEEREMLFSESEYATRRVVCDSGTQQKNKKPRHQQYWYRQCSETVSCGNVAVSGSGQSAPVCRKRRVVVPVLCFRVGTVDTRMRDESGILQSSLFVAVSVKALQVAGGGGEWHNIVDSRCEFQREIWRIEMEMYGVGMH